MRTKQERLKRTWRQIKITTKDFIAHIKGVDARFIAAFFIIISLSGCATMPRPSPGPVSIPGGVYHIVGSGQTLWRIAHVYGVDMKDIMRANNIKDPNQLGVGQELFIPGAPSALTVEPYIPEKFESINKIVGSKRYSYNWRYITLHHSATLEGNAEVFDRNHRKRRMGGLFYHFVIGNGTCSGNGQVEAGWRWRKQVKANRPYDIQICLVGDFNKQEVSAAQYAALLQLLKVLCKQYNIPPKNIRRHKDVADKVTECPGENFPFYKLIADLRKSL